MLACCAQDALAQVGIRRARSCGRWIEARVKVGIASAASEAWLTDYLSGLAAVSNLLAGMAPPCEPLRGTWGSAHLSLCFPPPCRGCRPSPRVERGRPAGPARSAD